MPHKIPMPLFVLPLLVITLMFAIPFAQPARAQNQKLPDKERNDDCIKCHENLYFLHDTGNWYCLRESPMTCTECHGGNASAITQEEAHRNRDAHPVINEDISKCQECHPDECYERMDIFNRSAGISEVLVAAPYTPVLQAEAPILLQSQEPDSNLWINFWDILPIALLAGAALTVYAVYHVRHRMK